MLLRDTWGEPASTPDGAPTLGSQFTLVKRVLRRHGYPSDKQERATLTVLQQAELLYANWAA